jgi:hypothetical protein
MKRILLMLAVVAGLVLAPAAAEASAFRGTVVKRNVATRTVVVATRAGRLVIVHGTRARIGTILRVSGTHIRVVGHTRHVRMQGLVTRRGLRSFNLSAGQAVVSLRMHGRRSLHAVGAGLVVRARITSGGKLDETSSDDSGDFHGAELKGRLLCIPTSTDCGTSGEALPPAGTLLIDIGGAGMPNVIPVAYDSTNPDFSDANLAPLVGQKVEANVNFSRSTTDPTAVTLTLVAIAAENSCMSGENDSEDSQTGTGGDGGSGGDDLLDGSSGSGQQGGQGDQGQDEQNDDDACEGDD